MSSDYLKRLDVQGHLKVKEALRKWDPIGVFSLEGDWPDDEYDAYSGHVVGLLDRGASKEEIVAYLKKTCVEHIGVGFDRPRTESIVEGLIAFGPVWQQKVRDLGPDYISE
jgi:hypothetical protein